MSTATEIRAECGFCWMLIDKGELFRHKCPISTIREYIKDAVGNIYDHLIEIQLTPDRINELIIRESKNNTYIHE